MRDIRAVSDSASLLFVSSVSLFSTARSLRYQQCRDAGDLDLQVKSRINKQNSEKVYRVVFCLSV